MASNALLPSNLPPGGNISAAIIQQVVDLVKQNITIIGGALSTTAGLAMLLPSLTVVIVNAIGFTAEGVVKGALGL